MSTNISNDYHKARYKKQTKKIQSGYSLVELLVATAIAGLLVVASASANTKLLLSNERATILHQMNSQLQFARSMAIARSKSIIICGSTNGLNCDGEWSSGVLISEADSPNVALSYTHFRTTRGELIFKSFPANRSSITFLPNGTLDRISNGSFWYCPEQNTVIEARRVTLSRVGETSSPTQEQPISAQRGCS